MKQEQEEPFWGKTQVTPVQESQGKIVAGFGQNLAEPKIELRKLRILWRVDKFLTVRKRWTVFLKA